MNRVRKDGTIAVVQRLGAQYRVDLTSGQKRTLAAHRVCLPMQLVSALGWATDDWIEFEIHEGTLVLSRASTDGWFGSAPPPAVHGANGKHGGNGGG